MAIGIPVVLKRFNCFKFARMPTLYTHRWASHPQKAASITGTFCVTFSDCSGHVLFLSPLDFVFFSKDFVLDCHQM